MSFACQSYVLAYHLYVIYVTRMYSFDIPMSLICHPYVFRMYLYVIPVSLVCHPYVTCMYSYVIRMSLVCGFTMNPRYLDFWIFVKSTDFKICDIII